MGSTYQVLGMRYKDCAVVGGEMMEGENYRGAYLIPRTSYLFIHDFGAELGFQ